MTERSNFAHLHARSWYSFRRGFSSPDQLVQQAVANGDEAVAITDYMSTAGAIPLAVASRQAGIRAIIGAEVLIGGYGLVLLCASNAGYATLNRLLTRAFEQEGESIALNDLRDDHHDLFVLTGGRQGQLRTLLARGEPRSALEFVKTLASIAPGRVFVELSTHQLEGEARMLSKLVSLAKTASVPLVATNDARYAVRDHAPIYDALMLSKHRLNVHDDHADRLWSREAWLKGRTELEGLIRSPTAFANASRIARECHVDLLPERINVPRATIPPNTTADLELEALCREGIKRRYPPQQRRQAVAVLEQELEVIRTLELADYFLIVAEVIAEARARRIRTSGRGSAAASIVVYSLGIAHADPLKFRMRFERFLHIGRFLGNKEAPDIDIDVQSDRRQELIDWFAQRFKGQTAMACNINTYGLRGAVRDVARLLGWSHDEATRMTKVLPYHSRPRAIPNHGAALEGVVGPSPLLNVLMALTERLDDCPRDLGLHSGGMLLARDSIFEHSAIKKSAGGTMQTFLDKRTAELAGLIKLDLLGLRILDVLQTAIELLEREGISVDLEAVDLEDARIFEGVKDGSVIGLFQIESPAQQALLAQLQPTKFLDLVAQVALIRPGPIQAQSVKPYIRRRNGVEKVSVSHASLEPILRQTYGLIIYQDQAIEVSQVLCGMSVIEADRFRKLISKARDRDDMEAMREEFVRRALATHDDLSEPIAHKIFDAVAGFSGYGFPLAHSVAFAITSAHTAFLKALYPAAFMCAVLRHEPGMYGRLTITEAAKKLGVLMLPISLERSSAQFDVERLGDVLAIRLGFAALHGLGDLAAVHVVQQRQSRPFSSLEDLVTRSGLPRDALDALAQSGALDDFGSRRGVLWQLGMLEARRSSLNHWTMQAPLFSETLISADDLALLEALDESELTAWDLLVTRTTLETHPMALVRPRLEELGVKPLNRIYDGQRCSVAGLVIASQRPQTARGITFVYLEDEFDHAQGIISVELWQRLASVLRSRAVILTGRVQRLRGWKTMVVESATALEALVPSERAVAYFAK
jgi:error-prone DNA polymerase